MKLIVGLGNPGDKYAGNRHNIGFMAVDEIARGYRFGPWKKRFQGVTAEGQIGVEKCVLLKPATYMNESGRAAGEAMRFFKLSPADVIVIHDELDLKPGMVRVKTGGGNAGHNGLKSLSAYIGNDYKRVRLGIGHPGDRELVVHYVLQDFAKADGEWLQPLLGGIASGMERLVEGGEANFLSEAARTRAAAKVNGAASLGSVAVPKTEAVAPVAARAAEPLPAEAPVEAPALVHVEAPVEAAALVQEPAVAEAPAPEYVETPVETPAPVQAPAVTEAPVLVQQEAPAAAPAIEQPAPAKAPEPQAITSVHVIAAREGTAGGAVSSAVILPEPERVQAKPAEPAPQRQAEAAPPPSAQAPAKKGFFGWLFNKRIRGGSGQ